jgi:glycosyltransferase involved in cell wall biosynthesis
MRIAVLSYPMLFQTRGGLGMKVGRTVQALCDIGHEARLIDPVREYLRDYDLVHVFAGYNGNHRLIEQAKRDGLPVVLSTIMNPPYSAFEGRRARFLNRLVGKLSNYKLTTNYWQLHTSMRLADQLVVLGNGERRMLIEAFEADPGKVNVVYNGVGHEFFNAEPNEFLQKYPHIRQPFVLHTGLLGDVKNQLGLAKAMAGSGVQIVLAGYAGTDTSDYLAQCLAASPDVVHLGELAHGSLIASACAAAAVVAIPSRHEGMPNSILEGLAADRPVVLTDNHVMDLELPGDVAVEVHADDHAAIRRAIDGFLRQPPPAGRARAVVQSLSWEAVARQLVDVYGKAIAGNRQTG